MEIYQEISSYLYENNMMDKSNIHSFGRWCMDSICKFYRPAVIHSNMMKQQQQQQQQQKQMQQPPDLSYPTYYTGDLAQPF
jgi:hypothetical protein